MAVNVALNKQVQYKPVTGLSNWVHGIFIISGIMSIVSFVSGTLQSELINNIINGRLVTLSEAQANDNREALIGYIHTAVLILGIIIFLMWVYRVNKNLHSFANPILKFSPGWTVGWFFVPFACLFQPYRAVSEISKASNPDIDPALINVDHLRAPAIVGWWWAFFLISNFVGQFVFRFTLSSDTPTDFLNSTYAHMVSDIVDIVGIIITIVMVRKISESQELRFEKSNMQLIKQEV